jgi:hypothetical protein
MSLLTEAQGLSRRPGGTCGMEALASRVASEAIARALEQRGHHIKYQTVARHRRGACACPS